MALREYFDNKVPVRPKPGDPDFVGPPAPNWRTSWNNLARQLYIVLPNQLDRARTFRNRFMRAVE